MALTEVERVLFEARRVWLQTAGRYVFRLDIYGVWLCGVQITPKRTADILNQDNGGKFSESQLCYHRIYLVFDAYYVFFPRFERHFNLWH
ncbi:hypothetical protein [Ralstonia sp. RL]|uniref:hypothetical protein n=1 Tax=Ralstonia sp. RL TaxID=1839756 RepID=UPI00258003BB|nr:hypothetical protein [Ralstonia sp. RL]